MNKTPATLQTLPERDLFAVIVFCIVIGVIVLQVGHALGKLEARVARVEAAVDTMTKGGKR